MDTIIDQQVARDEALIPHAKRLRIVRSNFRLLSNIKSKESTLQLVYDVLLLTPFFKAFLVTADVPEIYMEMLHICPRLLHQPFVEPPFEEEILAFLHFLGHSAVIRKHTNVNINKLHQPWRSFASIIKKCLTGKSSGYDSLRSYTPKPKDNVWKTRSSSDTTITPPTAAAAMTEAQQLKLATKRSLQQTHISQARDGDDVDEDNDGEEGNDGDDDQEAEGDDKTDDEEEGGDDEQDFDKEEFIHPSLSTHAKKEPKDEESFDHILKTPKETDDEGNGEENLGLNVGWEEGHDEEEEEDELYKDINIIQERGIQTTQEVEDLHVTVTLVNPDALTTLLQDLPNFGSLFGFDHRLKTLEENFSEFMQTNQFAGAVSAIPGIVQRYMDQQMNEAVKVAVQLQSEYLRDEAQQIMMKAEALTRPSNSSKTSYVIAVDLSEMELTKILIEKMEGNKFIHRSNEQMNLYKALVEAYESNKIILDTYGDTITLKRRRDDDADKDEEPFAGPDWGSKLRGEGKEPESASAPIKTATRSTGRSTQGSRSRQTSASESAIAEEPMQTTFEMQEPAHPEFEIGADDQPIVESVDTLTPELLAGHTYELMKGSCKSLVELEYQLEEVYKATTDQLNWVNPEGQQYPHNLLKPLPLIPNNRGRRVIPSHHFINNDLEYLRGGASSRKYTTSVIKTKAADYGHIKWIEDLVPRTIIIAVTELKILEWHNYKHLDWITVRRDDDKLYKFKEGNFKRLRIQDIEDMLLLLVQGKLTNLTVEERFAVNVSLRMFTRSIVIQCNKDKKKRLMKINELHKFSDGTLTDVRTALDDRLKGIRMQYLPQSI
nr:hypothetical protein [Tanacetum cinerariifolium]